MSEYTRICEKCGEEFTGDYFAKFCKFCQAELDNLKAKTSLLERTQRTPIIERVVENVLPPLPHNFDGCYLVGTFNSESDKLISGTVTYSDGNKAYVLNIDCLSRALASFSRQFTEFLKLFEIISQTSVAHSKTLDASAICAEKQTEWLQLQSNRLDLLEDLLLTNKEIINRLQADTKGVRDRLLKLENDTKDVVR